jgi:hypothetical protein
MTYPDRTGPPKADDGLESPKQRRIRRRQGSLVATRTPRRDSLPILGRPTARRVSREALALHVQPETSRLICRILARKLISIVRQPVLIAASRCYLIQMLGSAVTCANGCSCWSPNERNRPRVFLTIDARVVHVPMHHLTYPRNRAGERRCRGSGREAARGGERLRGAQFLANLWQGPAWSSMHEGRRHRPGSPRPRATGTSGALLSLRLRVESRARPGGAGQLWTRRARWHAGPWFLLGCLAGVR